MKHRFWAQYTAKDFAELPRSELIALLPVGAVEQHGPHLPLSVDQAIVDGMVAAVVPLLAPDLPVVFLPTLSVGKSNEHSAWPGTLTFSAATLMAMWSEIGDSVASAGVRKLVFLNSHGGQIAPMDIVARDLRIKHKMLVVAANWFAMGLPEGLISPDEERHGIHAGDLETSVMLALHPDLVRMDRARNFVPQNARLAEENQLLGLTPAGRLAWQMQDMNAAGAAGDATQATAEKGQRAIDHAAARIVTLLQEVHRMPLSFLDTRANPDAFA
ncbi:MAG: creatininase family protein [Pseudotabrizicola sp.]|uniref:creatininase family protein n=1 Tax=Pseudotabrizicola sp. TaxID=2939647 RepID=UPI0027306C65|nr:creatininase family protein [Pseudotabrizicola sp.]MDP2081835.1 creatininase family protein [Pseudotabrizicola sp.]MDZ7573875.1 creatininase family protein [Pseudotabrizicola sp.]